jgi:hypothetical protein
MSEIQYCEDCKCIMPNTDCYPSHRTLLAKCQKSPHKTSVRFVMRKTVNLDLYEFCTTVRMKHKRTCPEFEAKE